MKRLSAGIVFVSGMLMASAQAADYTGPTNQCVPLQAAAILNIDRIDALSDEVVAMMNEAIEISEDPEWTAFGGPAWVWSTEAAIACGKAYGYLRTTYRDEQYLNKCECFYRRMKSFMN